MNSIGFIVPCTACLRMYDAMHTQWCDCIGDDPTLRCPHCGRCFCRAAPKELYDKRKERTAAGTLPPDIARPMVLVVDDSWLIRATTMRIVRALGYGAIEAANADQALALTLLYQPEVVLTDALMPKVDGRELCRTIKNSSSTSDTKVILMTGLYKAAHYKYEAFHSFGVDEFLLKPVEPEQLRKLLLHVAGPPARELNFSIVA